MIARIKTAFTFELSFNLSLQSQPHWLRFNGTWQKRPRKLDHQLRFETEEMTLQIQEAVILDLSSIV